METVLEKYLKYYRALDAPGYAVMVTGAWGVGKTFQVKKILGNESLFYVSLFGIASVAEIHAAVLAAMHPNKTKMITLLSTLGGVAQKTKGTFDYAGYTTSAGAIIPSLAEAVLRRSVDKTGIIVFDDFERSKIDITDRFGLVNSYVEHYGCRVVVICNDSHLNEIGESKEKVFGHTIKVQPQADRAFVEKINLLKAPVSKLIQKNKELFLEIFSNSRASSLRVLFQAIQNVERLFECCTQEQRESDEAIVYILCLFLPLALRGLAATSRQTI